MSLLPVQESPIYTAFLPVSKQEVKFRPYKVKEKKLLLMANEAKDNNSIISAISQIVSNCVTSNIDTTELPITDVEYLFYNLRARSESEIVDLRYRCENRLEDGEICGNTLLHKLNLLTDLEVTESLPTTIKISDTIGVKMKHQKFEQETINLEQITPEQLFESVAEQVEFIYDENSVFNSNDISKKDIIEWLEGLTVEQYSKIEEFILNEPIIHKKISIKCKKCGMEHNLDVEGIFDFFI